MARRGTYQARQVTLVDPAAKTRALQAAGELVLRASQPKVPIDEGDLIESGDFGVDGNRVVIGYRDPKAVAVHEDMESDFRVGGPKYLEGALNESRGQLLGLIASELRRGMR